MDTLLPYLEWLTLISIATFLLSIIIIPWYVCRLPRDYFSDILEHPHHPSRDSRHIVLVVLKNTAGVILVAAGIAMLFLPGQGLLTMLIGILCMSFPGKRKLILYLITRPAVQRSLDWTRKKLHSPPFHWHP